MPIYRQINSGNSPEVLDNIRIEYHDDKKENAKESIVAQFGYGDIRIMTGASRNDYSDELLFAPAIEPMPIGYKSEKEDLPPPCFPPIRLLFDKRESIEAVIAELELLLEGFPVNQENLK